MKVFLVSMSEGPEGISDPLGVYSTREGAEKALREYEESDHPLAKIFGGEITELELDGQWRS